MKAFIAACVAIGILWGIDVEVNGERYTDIVKGCLLYTSDAADE